MTLQCTNFQNLGQSSIRVSPLAYGLWRFAGTDVKTATEKIETALDVGITFFDQADIYGCDGGGSFGDSEKLFGDVLRANPSLRKKMVIASKGGIVLGVPYDSSSSYLQEAVEKSLTRMGIETIDLYQIHRPDFLGHPAEIASVLTKLRQEGKIREVGVSNYTTSQFSALQSYLDFPIATRQPEYSCWRHDPLRNGILDQCLEYRTTPLAWSPLGGGTLTWTVEKAQAENPNLANLLVLLDDIANQQGVSRTSVALAWIMCHPSQIIPIIGTQTPSRIQDSWTALSVKLTRPEWNSILIAAQGYPLP
jgi:predicted oxidoreductase